MIKISDHKTLGAVCLAASLMMIHSARSQAAVGDTFIKDDLKYTVLTENGSSGTVSVKLNNYSAQNVSIPSTVENGGITYTVTTIGEYAFQHAQMPTITIPDSVITIEDAAFASCALQYITIPDSVITISNDAFYSCESMTNIVIGNNVKTIGNYAFEECEDLPSITIPDSVTDLGEYAFYKCKSLKSVVLSNGITIIGSGTFSGCRSLPEITLPDSVTEIDSTAFSSCRSLTNITLPDKLTSIGYYAFDGCENLTSITIPASVTSIEESAFIECQRLETVYYKGNAPQVEEYPWSCIYGGTPETLISYYLNDNASWKAAIVDGQWQTRGTAPWDPPAPATAKLSYDYQNGVLTLTFTGTLYQSTDTVNWTKVESAVSPYQVKIEKEKLFFRSKIGS